MKFKKDDEVKIVTGKDKGKTGKIQKVYPKVNKVLVGGVNIYKRHLKSQGSGKPGGIVEITKPLPVANIAFVCPKCKKQTRLGFQITGGEKQRICRKCRGVI